MKRTLIKNAIIVNEGLQVPASVIIEGEKIAEILVENQEPSIPCDETIDATGCYLLPGVIDGHVHFRDPGLTHKADIITESRAAAAGGVTSIMDMPNTSPQTTTLDALNAKLDHLAEKCSVNYSCYFGATNNNYPLLEQLDEHVASVDFQHFTSSCFSACKLDFSELIISHAFYAAHKHQRSGYFLYGSILFRHLAVLLYKCICNLSA